MDTIKKKINKNFFFLNNKNWNKNIALEIAKKEKIILKKALDYNNMLKKFLYKI